MSFVPKSTLVHTDMSVRPSMKVDIRENNAQKPQTRLSGDIRNRRPLGGHRNGGCKRTSGSGQKAAAHSVTNDHFPLGLPVPGTDEARSDRLANTRAEHLAAELGVSSQKRRWFILYLQNEPPPLYPP